MRDHTAGGRAGRAERGGAGAPPNALAETVRARCVAASKAKAARPPRPAPAPDDGAVPAPAPVRVPLPPGLEREVKPSRPRAARALRRSVADTDGGSGSGPGGPGGGSGGGSHSARKHKLLDRVRELAEMAQTYRQGSPAVGAYRPLLRTPPPYKAHAAHVADLLAGQRCHSKDRVLISRRRPRRRTQKPSADRRRSGPVTWGESVRQRAKSACWMSLGWGAACCGDTRTSTKACVHVELNFV